jgi:hypothetical protein
MTITDKQAMREKVWPVDLKTGDVITDAFGNEKTVADFDLRKGKATIRFTDGTHRVTNILATGGES